MKRILGCLTVAALFMSACGSREAGNTGSADSISAAKPDSPAVADMHNAENSLDIAGTYKGLLPCADCEGIETTLKLNNDQSFVLEEAYKGKKEAMKSEMKGKWVIHENTITLQFSKEVQDRILQYRAEENQLRMLDQQGKVIDGDLADHYILKKKILSNMEPITPYLNFNGNAAEALAFYGKAFDGKVVTQQTYGDSAMAEEESWKDKIMHAIFEAGSLTFMVSDVMHADQQVTSGNNTQLALNFKHEEDIDRVFAAMSEGARITMPLQDTFWGAKFGMLVDKFGIHWMFNFDRPKD